MRTKFPALVLALALFGAPAFAGAVRLTGNLSADILGNSSDGQSVNTFAVGGQPLFWGLGGDYGVSFFRDAGTQWFVAAGLAVNLDGLLLAAKAAYTPVSTAIPATDIPGRPLGALQVTLSAGVSFGW